MTKIILDCDPGHDDAIALFLAAGNPDIELVAVTTVAGNQILEKVTRNALAVGTVAGISGVPFAAGADRPLVRQIEIAPSIHGESGLDGPTLPEPTIELDPRHAVDVIIETVMAHEPGEITLVPTGVLTNIALAVRKEPRIVERVKEVVLMGGAVSGGNWSATAEFNVVVDPEAASVVFNAGWQVTMVGLDVTHKALATPAVLSALAGLDTRTARFTEQMLAFYGSTYLESQGFASPPVHDPVALAYVIDPTLLEVRRAPLDVELTGTLTLGMTVADLRRPAPADCPTAVALDLDVDRFWALVLDAVSRLP
ncbi:uridine-preferring nucleoside hydrolase UriH [Herbiconiux sp. SYSU D00978]|uniref:uridine-preferring nucleoside hydrolase UriH n=1 Tax=Herbiconiux sp. SYSU D00978 TaxID=2812562 RepID=UPI001A963E6D|nr:nucleoside hydrolase [Herbiconiux sp. SYSU D00978]